MQCKSCGHEVKSDFKYCPYCCQRLVQDYQDHYGELEPPFVIDPSHLQKDDPVAEYYVDETEKQEMPEKSSSKSLPFSKRWFGSRGEDDGALGYGTEDFDQSGEPFENSASSSFQNEEPGGSIWRHGSAPYYVYHPEESEDGEEMPPVFQQENAETRAQHSSVSKEKLPVEQPQQRSVCSAPVSPPSELHRGTSGKEASPAPQKRTEWRAQSHAVHDRREDPLEEQEDWDEDPPPKHKKMQRDFDDELLDFAPYIPLSQADTAIQTDEEDEAVQEDSTPGIFFKLLLCIMLLLIAGLLSFVGYRFFSTPDPLSNFRFSMLFEALLHI